MAAGPTVNDELVLLVRPVLAAVIVKLPAVSMTRLEKTAWPEEFVEVVTVDDGSNEPVLSVTLTTTPAWATLLLPESRSCTTGAVISRARHCRGRTRGERELGGRAGRAGRGGVDHRERTRQHSDDQRNGQRQPPDHGPASDT